MSVPETFFTVSEQLKLFAFSCFMGVPIGILYDILRIFRLSIRHKSWQIAIQDIVMMLVYAMFISVFSVYFARGEFRVFYVAGNILGFITYYFTAGVLVERVASNAISRSKEKMSRFFGKFKEIKSNLCNLHKRKTLSVDGEENSTI